MDRPPYILLNPDNSLSSDPRYKLWEENGGISVLFEGAVARLPTWEAAIQWIAQQPLPPGSLRLGRAVKVAAASLGIRQCGACAAREIKLNKVGTGR